MKSVAVQSGTEIDFITKLSDPISVRIQTFLTINPSKGDLGADVPFSVQYFFIFVQQMLFLKST
jgi:hypothetical protein